MPTEVYEFILYQKTADGEVVWLSFYQDMPQYGWQAPNINNQIENLSLDEVADEAAARLGATIAPASAKQLAEENMQTKSGAGPKIYICEAEVTGLDTEATRSGDIIYAAFKPEHAANAAQFSVVQEAIAKAIRIQEGREITWLRSGITMKFWVRLRMISLGELD